MLGTIVLPSSRAGESVSPPDCSLEESKRDGYGMVHTQPQRSVACIGLGACWTILFVVFRHIVAFGRRGGETPRASDQVLIPQCSLTFFHQMVRYHASKPAYPYDHVSTPLCHLGHIVSLGCHLLSNFKRYGNLHRCPYQVAQTTVLCTVVVSLLGSAKRASGSTEALAKGNVGGSPQRSVAVLLEP